MKKLLLAFGLIISSLHAYSQNGYSSVFLRVTDSATFVNSANTTAKHAANYADIWYSTVSGLFWKWSTVTNTYTLVGSGQNLGNTDLTSTGIRVFDGGGFNLTLENLDNFFVDANDGINIAGAYGQFVMQGGGTDELSFSEDAEIIGGEKLSIQALDSINFTAPIIKLGGQVGTTGQVPTINASGKLKYATPSGSGWATTGTTSVNGPLIQAGVTELAITAGASNQSGIVVDGTTETVTLLSNAGPAVSVGPTLIDISGAGLITASTGASGLTLASTGSTLGGDDVIIAAATSGTGKDIHLNVTNGDLKINGSAGTSGQVLTSNGSGSAPTWRTGTTNTSSALTDGAAITITTAKHTLTSTQATVTWTLSQNPDFQTTDIILNATSTTWTFPAGALCVVEGVASGNNTAALAGVSGDHYVMSIYKDGTNYRVAIKNFGQ